MDLANRSAYLFACRGIRLDEAERTIRTALKEYPEEPGYIDTLGWVLYKQKRYKESLEQLEKASKLAPDDDDIRRHLAPVYSKLGIQNPNKTSPGSVDTPPGQ